MPDPDINQTPQDAQSHAEQGGGIASRRGVDRPPAMAAFRSASARLGANPLLTQGAGGNTSLKADGLMWIKASGTWLRDAQDKDIMVSVDLARLSRAVHDGDPLAERGENFVIADEVSSGLRPSIETAVHAALDHAVVFHLHSIDTIAWAVRQDAERSLEFLLAGLDWAFVPYRRPGLQLAQEIATRVGAGRVEVLVLANHGLIVAADTVAGAEALLSDVLARLAIPPRPLPTGDVAGLRLLSGEPEHRLPRDSAIHALAQDLDSFDLAARGALYPDHVIFLGESPLAVKAGQDLALAISEYQQTFGVRPKWILVKGVGVLIDKDVHESADVMLRCLADVAARVPSGCKLNYLASEDIHALTNWEAEKYRQRMNR